MMIVMIVMIIMKTMAIITATFCQIYTCLQLLLALAADSKTGALRVRYMNHCFYSNYSPQAVRCRQGFRRGKHRWLIRDLKLFTPAVAVEDLSTTHNDLIIGAGDDDL